ncbi:TPA: hypothetical protein CPT96_03270 [Candidatus Gastranaerophilales bacterium HUM_10]|nr:MAG TPA: hypothetical protein CPT96_03270 [Candidatus Gastranaerophilales bacterium HUM_10]
MCNCYLVSSITLNETAGVYELTFANTPSVADNTCFIFRIPCNILTSATAGTPINAIVNINGTNTSVPLWQCNGNVLRTGTVLKTRINYSAQFGNDPNHLIIRKK